MKLLLPYPLFLVLIYNLPIPVLPYKNAEGADSPETARKLYTDYWNKVKYMKEYDAWCKNPAIAFLCAIW